MIDAQHDSVDAGTENDQYSPSSRDDRLGSQVSPVPIVAPRQRLLQPRPTENYLKDRDAAISLGTTIQMFWFDKGFPHARIWIEEIKARVAKKGEAAIIFAIRSNLINGMPPRSPLKSRGKAAHPVH